MSNISNASGNIFDLFLKITMVKISREQDIRTLDIDEEVKRTRRFYSRLSYPHFLQMSKIQWNIQTSSPTPPDLQLSANVKTPKPWKNWDFILFFLNSFQRMIPQKYVNNFTNRKDFVNWYSFQYFSLTVLWMFNDVLC